MINGLHHFSYEEGLREVGTVQRGTGKTLEYLSHGCMDRYLVEKDE